MNSLSANVTRPVKETLPHMELYNQRRETKEISNFLFTDKGLSYPCIVLEGEIMVSTFTTLINKGLLTLSQDSNIPKITLYFKVGDSIKELRQIDWELGNYKILNGIDPKLSIIYFNEEGGNEVLSLNRILEKEVIEL